MTRVYFIIILYPSAGGYVASSLLLNVPLSRDILVLFFAIFLMGLKYSIHGNLIPNGTVQSINIITWVFHERKLNTLFPSAILVQY